MPRTLVLTNHVPASPDDRESFGSVLAGLLPPAEVVVYTATRRGGLGDDDTRPFPVLRDPARTLLPTAKVTAGVVDAFQAYGCDRALLDSAAPLGLLAPALRAAGAVRIIGLTSRAEPIWARVPVARQALRRIGDATDVLTYAEDAVRAVIAPALSLAAAGRMVRLSPGPDTSRFRPGGGGAAIRQRYGLAADAPVVVYVGALTSDVALDVLLRSFAAVSGAMPSARMLVVGGGAGGRRLARTVRSLGLADAVVLTGPVEPEALPAYFDAGDVLLAPGSSRLGDRWPQPPNLAVLQAQASGLPVVLASSRGEHGPVIPDETGLVVPVRDVTAMADGVLALLQDPARSMRMGAAGRAEVERGWSLDVVRSRLAGLLA